jgi:diaminohydroxyphosphoribosylaminopyrimidine deaminase / 5-amino-6-(5-phosphoribosylamino)uracil reductase
VSIHEFYIKRCIQLAQNGLGTTYPNPLVGSVVVHNSEIIGEGWHQKAGGAHAEVMAIQSVKDKSLLKNATIYVSLEPCSHFGKTPPCSDLIIHHKIPSVIIGTQDPFAEVSGNGIRKLKEAGCNVSVGFLEAECNELNKRFFTFHKKQRPYIILKWAQTTNGFIAPQNKELKQPVWISNQYSRQLVHKWRSEEQSILVGAQTVLDDNPVLTVRDWTGNNPVRIVLDKNCKISKESLIFDSSAKTILLSNNDLNDRESVVKQMVNNLFLNNVQSVIIEGGSKTLQSFIDENLWDEARVFIGDSYFLKGTKAPLLYQKSQEVKKINGDQLLIYSNHD